MTDIAANVRAIDTLKGEILSELAKLYTTLSSYENESAVYEEVETEIATITAMSYILAKRLGLSYESVDERISQLLEMAVENGHEIERVFGDMSELAAHVKGR